MPNWCSTKIIISHESENKLIAFNKLLDKWTSKDYMPNGFGHSWLGNIVLGSEIGTVDEDPNTDIRCRGWISYKDLYANELTIDTETAWAPMLHMWIRLVDKYLPDATIIYNAEEPGCGIYDTNDEDLIGKYILDSWDDNVESDYEMEEETLIRELQRIIGTTETDINKLIKMTEDDDYDFSIHKWEYKNINEWS